MTIVIRSSDDQPYGCFAPDSHCYRGLGAADGYWTSVDQLMLAHRLARAEDREAIRKPYRSAEARALAATMEERPGWRADFAAALERAVLGSFERDLARRAALLSTGDEPIEAHLDDPLYDEGNLLGRVLVAVRAKLRERFEDADAIQCDHQDAKRTGAVCVHLLSEHPEHRRFHRRFTGHGARYERLCPACVAALPAPPALRKVCDDCFLWQIAGLGEGDVGMPEFRERPSDVRFEHRTARVPGVDPAELVGLVPVPRAPHAWLALDRAGRLLDLTLPDGTARLGPRLPAEAADLRSPLGLHVAPGGELAAVAEVKGRRAVVLDLRTGEVTQRIERDDYHPDVTPFALAFFEHAGALRLVYCTEWNRLDVSDPFTGRLLTPRPSPRYEHEEKRPPHYLDYFHASLLPSPSGARVLDNGWVWQPSAVPRTFSLRRWLDENVWESEDGPSAKELLVRESWPVPAAWLEEPLIAFWGEGEEDLALTPGVRIFDADTGQELRSFAGPDERIFYDAPYLVACGASGASVWDVVTGERLAVDPLLRPLGYHPASHEFVSPLGADEFRVSRRV